MNCVKCGKLVSNFPDWQWCDDCVLAMAKVGMTALVDEATGYQKDRADDALAKKAEEYKGKR